MYHSVYIILIILHLVHGAISKVHPEKMSKHITDDDGTTRVSNEALDRTSLICPPCEQLHCRPRRPGRLRCKGGLTLGICDCCPVCAKIEGESCGGHSNYLGKCDYGLYCESQGTQVVHYEREGTKHVYHIAKGICKKVPNMHMPESQDDFPPFCRPKCTAEFCLRNPKSICSAQSNAETKHQCQGSCQHTSCRACRFTQPLTTCNKCHPDDFRCIRQFGKCVRQTTCSRQKYPCKVDADVVHDHKVKFVCKVPDCYEN